MSYPIHFLQSMEFDFAIAGSLLLDLWYIHSMYIYQEIKSRYWTSEFRNGINLLERKREDEERKTEFFFSDQQVKGICHFSGIFAKKIHFHT